jgi:hypothetical protein
LSHGSAPLTEAHRMVTSRLTTEPSKRKTIYKVQNVYEIKFPITNYNLDRFYFNSAPYPSLIAVSFPNPITAQKKHNNLIDRAKKQQRGSFICCRYIAISQNTHYYDQVYGHNNKNRFSMPVLRLASSFMHRTRNRTVGPRMTDKRGPGGVGRREETRKRLQLYICLHS